MSEQKPGQRQSILSRLRQFLPGRGRGDTGAVAGVRLADGQTERADAVVLPYRSASGSASAVRPDTCRKFARLLVEVATSGWSAPSARSRIDSARR